MKKIIIIIISLLLCSTALAASECFIIKENNSILHQAGECSLRHPPCSTFKIAISLMGFNEGILIDKTHPVWPYKPGYPAWLATWKQSQNPARWIKNSCVWYSQQITQKLGMPIFQKYVSAFNYGNMDVSGDKGKHNGLQRAWLTSSLQISGAEQIDFLQRMLTGKLPVSKKTITMSHELFYLETLPNGWKLYGKTGAGAQQNPDGSHNESQQIGWFVGWLEKGPRQIIFARYVETSPKESPSQLAKASAKAVLLKL